MPSEWFYVFFDELYYETYRVFEGEDRNEAEARFIVEALGLEGGRVLDVGCGYARHAVYLARWGLRVTCLDLSEYMLSRAVERVRAYGVEDRVEVVRGDMRRLDYVEEFDGAYMFYTTFGYFSDEENADVIRRLARALRPGGRLLIDLSNPLTVLFDAHINGGSWRSWHKADSYLVLEESRLDLATGRIHTDWIIYRGGGEVSRRGFTLRLYPLWEMRALLEAAGLSLARVYGSTRGEDYSVSSPRMIVVAERPGGRGGSRGPS